MKEKDKVEINEQFLISMMAKEEPVIAAPVVKNQPEISPEIPVPNTDNREGNDNRKRKKHLTESYEGYFLKNSEETARYGKTIYIRKEFHERIQRICQVIGDNQISLYSYIDNVLAHHFETYKEDIRQVYDQKQKPII